MSFAAQSSLSNLHILLTLLLSTSTFSLADTKGYGARAVVTADRITRCTYDVDAAVWVGEALWQSGNTLESLSNLALANQTLNQTLFRSLLTNSYLRTAPVVDKCFDDHQWWLLAWVRAFEATGEIAYINRAAQVFDFVVEFGWTAQCGGGILWCPTNGTPGYKNAM